MRPKRVELYEIDETPYGEILIATPDLGVETRSSFFSVQDDELVISYDNGETVCLPDLPPLYRQILGRVDRLMLMEMNDRIATRCHMSERKLA